MVSRPSPERLHQSLAVERERESCLFGISNLIPRPQSNCFSCARKSSPVHLGLACAQAARPPCASWEPRWSAIKRPLRQALRSGPHQRHRTSSPKHSDCCMCALSLLLVCLHFCICAFRCHFLRWAFKLLSLHVPAQRVTFRGFVIHQTCSAKSLVHQHHSFHHRRGV